MSGWKKLDVHQFRVGDVTYEIIGFDTHLDPGYLYRVERDCESLADYRGIPLLFADIDEAKDAVHHDIEDRKQ